MIDLQGKGAFLYVISYVEGANQNVIWPADSPERLAHAERIADVAEAAELTHVLIKVADGIYPYNRRRRLDDGRIIFNSTVPEAVDDCPAVVAALKRRGIKVYGWQFIYGKFPEAEARVAIQRMRELDLDGWVVNAEYAHKIIAQGIEATRPPAEMVAKVDAYMRPVAAETKVRHIPLFLSSYKYPSKHPSFPWAAFLKWCDGAMPQVYPIGDTRVEAHTIQLAKSLLEYRELAPGMALIPTGGAFSESYRTSDGKTHAWVATPAQVQDFLRASEREGVQAANVWEWFQAKERFPDLWSALAAYTWAAEDPELPPVGAGDPQVGPGSGWAWLRKFHRILGLK